MTSVTWRRRSLAAYVARPASVAGSSHRVYRLRLIIRSHRTIRHRRRIRPLTTTDRAGAIEAAVAGFETLMQRLALSHAPEFVEIDVTMPQAKVLYLLAGGGELHMAELVQRLGVSLSTVSGLVDRVVDHGLVVRREDPADRRQVVVSLTPAGAAFIDRFRELNSRQLRDLLAWLDDDGLGHVRDALAVLGDAASRLVPDLGGGQPPDAHPSTDDPPSPDDPARAGPAGLAPIGKDPA